MRIDIVIPAFNEEKIIGESIREINTSLASFPHPYTVIVADNGSQDTTGERARAAGASVLTTAVPGKGAALSHAAGESTAPLFAFIDADLSAHPKEIARLYAAMREQSADIVIGSRLMNRGNVNRSFLRTFSSKAFNAARRLLLGINVSDTQCGLKLMNERGRQLLAKCTEKGWFIDLELLARAERAGLSIVELPVAWEEFRYADRKSKLHVLSDGMRAFAAMLRIRENLG